MGNFNRLKVVLAEQQKKRGNGLQGKLGNPIVL